MTTDRAGSTQGQARLPVLRRPRNEVEDLIRATIGEAAALLSRMPSETHDAYDETERKFRDWFLYCRDHLRSYFDSDSVAEEFVSATQQYSIPMSPSVAQLDGKLSERIRDGMARLESFQRRLDLWEPPAGNVSGPMTAGAVNHRQVFVVHGHDGHAKEATARLLQRLELEPIILDEQINRGATLMEKLEAHAEVSFAVVLLTPDDVGGLASDSTDTLQRRARQNVIFELGYFIGRLGRQRVVAILDPPLEQPSDISGVVYIRFDPEGAWRFRLASELDPVFGVDFNLIK